MTRLRGRYRDGAYLTLPRIEREDAYYQWISGFWDRPLSGLARCRGQTCWFELVGDTVERDGRVFDDYLVVALTAEQIAEEEHWHEQFRRYVGRHWDYLEDEHRRGRPANTETLVQPSEQHHLFYDAFKARAEPDYSANPVIGWYAIDASMDAEDDST